MAMIGISNTVTQNFDKTIKMSKKFVVPKFQRDYSWDKEQWSDLWDDIETMLSSKDERYHYMGYLVLQEVGDEESLIIDGQQRFTTIVFIILAAMKSIKNMADSGFDQDENRTRYESLAKEYVGDIDTVSLEYDNILKLNRNNDGYFKDYIVKLEQLPVRNLNKSEKLMKSSFDFFESKLSGKFATGAEYANFIKNIVNGLYFTIITVTDEMNAFRVFETLNARGVQLSSADLLKNYFFSLVDNNSSHSSRINSLDNLWEKLTSIIQTKKLPDFIRYYWNCSHKSVRSAELFKVVKNEIKTDKEVFAMVNDMIKYADIFMALQDPNDETWKNDSSVANDIRLLKLFGLKQPLSMLMAAFEKKSFKEFAKLLHYTIFICFRYNVISNRNPNDMEKVLNSIATEITKTGEVLYSELQKIYVDDNTFVSNFQLKEFGISTPDKQKVRYILGIIEKAISAHEVSLDDESATIEHILPQNPDESWDVDDIKIDRLVYRLGNLCLLERSLNSEVSNKNFEDKTNVYKKSSYRTTSSIAEVYQDWNEDTINKRQKKMADIAKGYWSIDFFKIS